MLDISIILDYVCMPVRCDDGNVMECLALLRTDFQLRFLDFMLEGIQRNFLAHFRAETRAARQYCGVNCSVADILVIFPGCVFW